MTDNHQLTPTDRQLLAREVAADKRIDGSGYYNERMREVFCTGWDAAMEWIRQQRNPCGEEEQGYPHFSDGEMPLG